jgi:5'-nucleotidase
MTRRPVLHATLVAALAVCLALGDSAASAAPASGGARFQVHLLGVNDLHGNLTGAGLRYTDPYTGLNAPAGGAGVLAHALRQREAAHPGTTLLVHAGDMVGGSPPESGLLQDEPTIRVLNELGFDVGTPGNHEFDEGLGEFFRLLDGGDHPATEGTFEGQAFPQVSANVVSSRSGLPLLPPYAVKRVNGVKIGFLGATTVTTPTIVTEAGVRGVRFLDEADAVNRYVPALKRQGVEAMVLLIHEGGTQSAFPEGTISPRISEIVPRLHDEIDLVMAGHSHSVLNAEVDGRLVVQASSFGRAFEDVTLTLSRRSRDVVAASAEVVPVWRNDPPGSTSPVPADPAVQAIVDRAVEAVAPLVNRKVNTAAVDLPNSAAPSGESALGNLIADAQRATMKTQLALMNPGGIRAGISAGEVTWGELFAVQPFGNDLVGMNLTGAQVWTLLGQQFQRPFNRILQISGLHYRYRSSGPGGGEILGVWTGAPGDETNPVPNDPGVTYTVTVNSFLAGGGDNFTVLREGTDRVVGPVDLDALVDYVAELTQPFRAQVEGRIELVS